MSTPPLSWRRATAHTISLEGVMRRLFNERGRKKGKILAEF
jgi:hypothetical protein